MLGFIVGLILAFGGCIVLEREFEFITKCVKFSRKFF
jgi:hypothetical protein